MNKPKKVNVSVNPETMSVLIEVRDKLTRDLGFSPSLSEVIQHLTMQYKLTQKD